MKPEVSTPSLDTLLHQLRYVQAAPFFSGVIHDLNNRLGAIIAYADLLSMGSNSQAEIDEMLDNIIAAARQAQRIGDGLGLIVRQDDGTVASTNIPKIVELVAGLCEFRMRSKNIEFDIALDGELNREHTCNANDVARAMTYLLRNAMENVEDLVNPKISCSVVIGPDSLEIRVSDNGPKMAEDEFKQLRSANVSTKDPGAHLGLGLPGVDRIAARHEGELTYDPELGLRLTLRAPEA